MSLREQRYYAHRKVKQALENKYHDIIDPILNKKVEVLNKKHTNTVKEIEQLDGEAHKLLVRAERLRTKMRKSLPVCPVNGRSLYSISPLGRIKGDGGYYNLNYAKYYESVLPKTVYEKVKALAVLLEEAEMVIELSGNRDLLGAIKDLNEKIEQV